MREKQNRAQEAKARAARVLALNEKQTRTRSTAVAGLVAPEGTPQSAAQRSRDLKQARSMASPHPTTPSQTGVANDVSTNSGESPGTPAQTEARTRRVRRPPLAGFLRAHGQLQGNDEQERNSEPLPRSVDDVGEGDIPENWRATYVGGNFTLEMISPVAAAPNAVPEHGLLSFPMSRPAVEQVQAHLAAVRAATSPATERAGVRSDRGPAQRQRGMCPPSTPPQPAPPRSRTPVHGVIATVNDGRIGHGREMGTETGTHMEIEVPSPEMIAAMQHALLADALTPRRSRASFRGGTHLDDAVDVASRRVPTNLELRAQEHGARGSDSEVPRSDSTVQSMEDGLIAADLQARLFLSEEDRTPAREQQSVRREARSATPWPPMPNPASAEVQLQLPATATERPRPAGVGPESSAASSQGSGWHREDLSYESLLQLDEGVKRVGLKPAQLEKLGRAAIRLRAASGCGAADCCICLDVLDAGAEGWQLPCRHEFHAACISTWLQEHVCCPTCRTCVSRV